MKIWAEARSTEVPGFWGRNHATNVSLQEVICVKSHILNKWTSKSIYPLLTGSTLNPEPCDVTTYTTITASRYSVVFDRSFTYCTSCSWILSFRAALLLHIYSTFFALLSHPTLTIPPTQSQYRCIFSYFQPVWADWLNCHPPPPLRSH